MIRLLIEKSKILKHHQNFINFVEYLGNLDEQILRKPIDQGKWSVIEIVAHFYPWDEFVLHHRLPYLFKNEPLPKSPNAKDLNSESALSARIKNIENTLTKCLCIRNKLYRQLSQIPEDKWLVELQISQSSLTLYEYLKGLMEHDIHHLEQIKSALKLDDY